MNDINVTENVTRAAERKELIDILRKVIDDLENGYDGFMFLHELLIPHRKEE